MKNPWRCSLPLVLLVLLGGVRAAPAETKWWVRHGLTFEDFAAWVEGESNNFRIVYLNGCDMGGQPRFVALGIQDGKKYGWHWRVGTLEKIQKDDAEYRAKGYRVISVSGFPNGNRPQFAVIWINDGQPARERMALHLTEKEYTERLAAEKKRHYMPKMVTGYSDGEGSYRFAALFVPAQTPWQEQHDLTSEQYQTAVNAHEDSGERPTSLTVYSTPAGLRFAAVFTRDKRDWEARHDLTEEDYQEVFNELKKDYIPISITAYPVNNSAGVELFDEAMRSYMKESNISAGTLAVSHNGKLLLARGYGVANEGGRPVEAEDPMRLASVSKPITAAAIRMLVREGKLALETRPFRLLGLKPPAGRELDPRLNDITIEHLLEHKGGWDRTTTFDPMDRPLEVAGFLKAPAPPGPVDIIRYMMAQPLQFDPGTRRCYSNFGYCVLGRVIEKVSGETYVGYIQKHLCGPLGAHSVELARSLPRYRNPREPVYHHPHKGRNIVDPLSQAEVPLPDGTFYVEAMDAHGGLIASSRDVLRFLDAYWISGEPRQGKGFTYVHFGQMPGSFTLAMQRPNGVNVVALFNKNPEGGAQGRVRIQKLLRETADRQSETLLNYATLWEKSE